MSNRFSRFINKVNYAPKKLRPFFLTKFFCTMVKFAGTTGISIRSVSHEEVKIKLVNKKKVQNHIGGVHAVAAALLAESATGIVFGMNVPDGSVPLLKSMKIEYQRRIQGSLTAIAHISEEQRQEIEENDKGDMIIAVHITDESNEQPIVCTMDWAWVKKRS
jgi:uncharacterized protein (TIGR00369 family)